MLSKYLINKTHILLFVLLLCGCNSKTTSIVWDYEATRTITSSNIVIFSEIDEIRAKKDITIGVGGYMGMFGGAGGAIIGSLIEASQNGSVTQSSVDDLIKATKNNLSDFSISEELKLKIDAEKMKLKWLNVRSVKITQIEKTQDNIINLLIENEEDVLIVLRPTYYFSSDMRTLVVKGTLEMYPKRQNILTLKQSKLGERKSRIMDQPAFAMYELPDSRTSIQQNILLWLENSGVRVKTAVISGTKLISTELIQALSAPFPIALYVTE